MSTAPPKGIGQGRRRITREMYDKLVEAFDKNPLDKPGKLETVARSIPVDRRTAAKAWWRGWPGIGMPPIKNCLEDHRVAVRIAEARKLLDVEREAVLQQARDEAEARSAAILAAAELEAAKVRGDAETAGLERLRAAEEATRLRVQDILSRSHVDAAEQLGEEVMLSRAARKNALQAHGFLASFWQRVARPLADKLVEWVTSGTITPVQGEKLMEKLLRGTRDVVQASRIAIQTERLRVGDPTEVIGFKVEPADIEEATKDITHAWELLQLAKRRAGANGGGNGRVHADRADPPNTDEDPDLAGGEDDGGALN